MTSMSRGVPVVPQSFFNRLESSIDVCLFVSLPNKDKDIVSIFFFKFCHVCEYDQHEQRRARRSPKFFLTNWSQALMFVCVHHS